MNVQATLGLALSATVLLPPSVQAQTNTTPSRPRTTQTAQKPPAPAGMMNADVIKMVKAGLSDEIVLTAVEGAKQKSFDLSVDGLIQLKTAGVSERVVLAMQGRVAVASTAPPLAAASAAPIATPSSKAATSIAAQRDPGIYVMIDGVLTEVSSTPVTSAGAGAGSMLASGFTMGLKKVKVKAEVRGSRADLRLDEHIEFLFYGSDFNANDFVLARLQSGDSKREVTVGEAGMLGVRNGLSDDEQVSIRATRIDSGVFKVVPDRDLRPGEYAFIKIGNEESRRLWDFGVDR